MSPVARNAGLAVVVVIALAGYVIYDRNQPTPDPYEGLAGAERSAAIQRDLDAMRSANLATAKTAVVSRMEFENSVIDKCGDAIIGAIGRPDSTQQSGSVEFWHYRDRSRDPVTGKVDALAQVALERGCARRVSFG